MSTRVGSDRLHPQIFYAASFDMVELTLKATVSTGIISGIFKMITPAGITRSIVITGTDAGILYGTSYALGGTIPAAALWTISFGNIMTIPS